METFPTPRPVEVQIHAGQVAVELTAADTAAATVATLDAGAPPLAELFTTELDGERLLVHERRGAQRALGGRRLGVRVTVPTGSGLDLVSGDATLTADGALGDVRLMLKTATARLERVDGTATVTCAGGALVLDEVGAKLAVTASSCDVTVGRSRGEIEITVAGGDVELARVESGQASVETSSGRIDVGVAAGTVAWLDAESKHGSVENRLTTQDDPDGFAAQASLRLKTRTGDIGVRRAA